jgi:hypothetical protein
MAKLRKGYISKTAVFDLNTILDSVIDSGFDGFLDLLVDSIDMGLLMDITYKVVCVTRQGGIKIRITGDASECNEEG